MRRQPRRHRKVRVELPQGQAELLRTVGSRESRHGPGRHQTDPRRVHRKAVRRREAKEGLSVRQTLGISGFRSSLRCAMLQACAYGMRWRYSGSA